MISVFLFSLAHIFLLFFLAQLVSVILQGIFGLKFSFHFFEWCWIGYGFLLTLLMALHFVLPVHHALQAVVLGLAGVGAAAFAAKPRAEQQALLKPALWAGVAVLCCVYFACQNIDLYDTYLYHLQVVKWYQQDPIVPGLANVHTRFGFNSAFHLYAAFAESEFLRGFWAEMPGHVAVCTLVSLFLSHFAFEARRFFYGRYLLVPSFCLLSLPFVVLWIVQSVEMSSLSPDLINACQTLVCVVWVLKLCEQQERHRGNEIIGSLFLVLLGGTLAFVTKQSNILLLPFCVLFVSVFFPFVFRKIRMLGAIAFLPILLCGLHIARNVVLSGWPFYPVRVWPAPVDWLVPAGRVKDVLMWVNVFNLGTSPTEYYQKGAAYFGLRSLGHFLGTQPGILMVLWGVAFALWCTKARTNAEFANLPGSQKYRFHRMTIALFIMTWMLCVLWLWSAPAYRLGAQFSWCCLLIPCAIFLRHIGFFRIIICLIAFLPSYWAPYQNAHPPQRRSVFSLHLWRPEPPIAFPVRANWVSDGIGAANLVLYTPDGEGGDRCGSAPLPCAVDAGTDLRLRHPPYLRGGFQSGKRWLSFDPEPHPALPPAAPGSRP